MKPVQCCTVGVEYACVEKVPMPPIIPDGVRIAAHAIGVSFTNLLVIFGKRRMGLWRSCKGIWIVVG